MFYFININWGYWWTGIDFGPEEASVNCDHFHLWSWLFPFTLARVKLWVHLRGYRSSFAEASPQWYGKNFGIMPPAAHSFSVSGRLSHGRVALRWHSSRNPWMPLSAEIHRKPSETCRQRPPDSTSFDRLTSWIPQTSWLGFSHRRPKIESAPVSMKTSRRYHSTSRANGSQEMMFDAS
jgi:hypothetical protein